MGLNVAAGDVRYLSGGLSGSYRGNPAEIDKVSVTALKRVWKAVCFSWRFTSLVHEFSDAGALGQKLQNAELDQGAQSSEVSTAMAMAMAENYVGLPV